MVKGRGHPYETDTEKMRPPGGAALGCGLAKDALSRDLYIRFTKYITLFWLSDAKLWDDVVVNTQLQESLHSPQHYRYLLARRPDVKPDRK